MCTASVAGLVFENEAIQNLLANPCLDMVHRQVALTLYALDAEHRLGDHESLLPVYLGLGSEDCVKILGKLEDAGLLTRSEHGIELTHPLDPQDVESSCGCH